MDKQTKSGMPVDESKYSFTIPRTDEPREKILKLGAMITDRIGKVTGNDPEYWGLAGVVTDEMADVALKMKVRKPKTTAQIAALTGKSEEELEKLLTEMAYIGLVEYNWENLDGKTRTTRSAGRCRSSFRAARSSSTCASRRSTSTRRSRRSLSA